MQSWNGAAPRREKPDPNPSARYNVALFPLNPAYVLQLGNRVVIISHSDAGKTTITVKLLLFGGAIQLAARAERAAGGARHGEGMIVFGAGVQCLQMVPKR